MSSRFESDLLAIINSDGNQLQEPHSRAEQLLVLLFNKIESLESEVTTLTEAISTMADEMDDFIIAASEVITMTVSTNGYIEIPLTIPEGYTRLHDSPIVFISGSTTVRPTGDSVYQDGKVRMFLVAPNQANVTIKVEYICKAS